MESFDAHVHSAISDGTDDPRALVELAAARGVRGIALTDHDTFEGWISAAEAATDSGLTLIRGVELSTSYRGSSVHLLAYLPDRLDEGLLSTMEQIRGAREQRLRRMVEALGEDYPRITWESLLESGAAWAVDEAIPWGRPHLADLLIAEGYVRDREEAFAHLLRPGGPYFAHQWAPHPADMVETVRAAGGVPVLAHPLSRERQRPLPIEVIGDMTDAGLFGLERDHREHDDIARAQIDELARRFDLAVTGGSDYHGQGKPNLLGENATAWSVIERIAEQGRTPVIGL